MPTQFYSPFHERLISYLLPYFLPLTSDIDLARAEVVETLESYGARTRSEMINAMRIISLSFASMDLLAAANNAEMPTDIQLSHIRHANGLARICQQNESALAKRLATDLPEPLEQAGEPIDDASEAELEAVIQQSQAQINAYCKSPPGPRATPVPQQQQPQWVNTHRPAAPA
jgi:hypothetical protein